MTTLIETEIKQSEFLPVNDEYQPFRIVSRRNFMQENLEIPAMVKIMNLPLHKRILEIGCGPGVALPPLANLCKPTRLVGIDSDADLLCQAHARLRDREIRAELYQQDVRNLAFSDAAFDIVIDFGTCYHINRRVMALKEISRILSKGGLFVCETPFNQFLSHPVRSFRKRIPWQFAPELRISRYAVMWSSRIKE